MSEMDYFATRTMRALEVLAFGPASALEVASALQVDPRTARRLLNRLVEDGYVVRLEPEGRRRRYAPTLRLVALAGHVVERAALAEVTLPFVARLHERSGHVAHLSIPSYGSVLCVVHQAGEEPVVVRPQLGGLVPCHCTAAGKALLAYRDRWRESVLAARLERHTDRTVSDPHELRREMMQIRARGFALEDRECREDLRGLASPVFNHTGEAVAALGVTLPASEVSAAAALDLGPMVAELAAATSEALGRACGPSLAHPVPSRDARWRVGQEDQGSAREALSAGA
jgi:IclR family acetate operon transcriptional repressor